MTDHADTIRRAAEDRLREWLTTDDPAPSYAWTDPDVLIPDVAALMAEVDSARAERQQAIDALREIANYRSLTKPQDHKAVARAALVSLGETE